MEEMFIPVLDCDRPGIIAAVSKTLFENQCNIEEVSQTTLQTELDGQLSEVIKRTAFKVTHIGELIGRQEAGRLEVPFGVIDLSMAPLPNVGESG